MTGKVLHTSPETSLSFSLEGRVLMKQQKVKIYLYIYINKIDHNKTYNMHFEKRLNFHFMMTLRKWIVLPLEPVHGVLDTVTVALKEERKHKYAAPQHAHLWPDRRTINNRTESKPMRFPLQSCPAAISNGNTQRLRAAMVLLLLWFSLSAHLTCSVSSK